MSVPIAMRPGGVDDLVDALHSASSALAARIERLESSLAAVVWEGSAEQAYRIAQGQWADVMADMSAILEEASGLAQRTRDVFTDTEKTVAGLWVKS